MLRHTCSSNGAHVMGGVMNFEQPGTWVTKETGNMALAEIRAVDAGVAAKVEAEIKESADSGTTKQQ